MSSSHIDPFDFVLVVETAETLPEAAEKLGLTRAHVRQRASRLRGMGVELKRFNEPPTVGIDVKGLNKYIHEIRDVMEIQAL